MFNRQFFNIYYKNTKNSILDTVLNLSRYQNNNNNQNSNYQYSNNQNSNNFIETIPLYKQIIKIIKQSIDEDSFNLQYLCFKIIEKIYSEENNNRESKLQLNDNLSKKIVEKGINKVEDLPSNILFTIDLIIHIEIGLLIHIIFLNYYYQDETLNKKYIRNMIPLIEKDKGNFLLLCIDLLINQGSQLQKYTHLIDEPSYQELKEYLINDPSNLINKANGYLDTFIIDIFESIDESNKSNLNNQERYNKNRKIIMDLVINIFNHNKDIMKEIMEINLNILSKNNNIILVQESKDEIFQLIETVYNYNIINIYQK